MRCAAKANGISSQLSILELDLLKIQTILEGFATSPSSRGTATGSSGQGFGLSQAERKQVELRAMRIARKLYEDRGWEVVDKSNSHPYDLLATRNGETLYIEVKGTTGAGHSVVLTHGEVKHVRHHKKSSALVIVSGIVLTESNGTWDASGGTVTTHEAPWTIDDSRLEATEYRYSVQQKPSN